MVETLQLLVVAAHASTWFRLPAWQPRGLLGRRVCGGLMRVRRVLVEIPRRQNLRVAGADLSWIAWIGALEVLRRAL